MDIFLSIARNSILPIFILIAAGFCVDRVFCLDNITLTKINIYLFVPAFAFVNILTTEITADLLGVIALVTLLLAVTYALASALVRALRLPPMTARAFENAWMFYNAGNVGVSLTTLVFSNPPFASGGQTPYLAAALSVQIMVLLVQNLTTNTLGFINGGGMSAKDGLKRVIRMPTLYAILCAVLFRFVPFDFTTVPLWPSLVFLRNGMVSVALVTLGVQLSKTKMDFGYKLPYLAVGCRLVGGPALMLLLIRLFGIDGVVAQVLFISSATPTAVNTALLSVEGKGDVAFAVQAVILSTLASAVTMTTAIYLAYLMF